MKSITDLVKSIIGNVVSEFISKGASVRLPVDILHFYEIEDGVEVCYKTKSMFGTDNIIVKKGLFFLKGDQWHFGELDYRATVDEYLAEKEGEKVVEVVE